MMKQVVGKRSLADLEKEAEDKTFERQLEAEGNILHDWNELVSCSTLFGKEDHFAKEGIFKRASEYLRNCRQLMAKGVSCHRMPWTENYVRLICQFSFEYDYDMCSVENPNAEDPFVLESTSDRLMPHDEHKEAVMADLKAYLLEGAAFARNIGSSAYQLWQEVLIDFEFRHRQFADGAEREDVKALFDRITRAGQMTHVDREVVEWVGKSSAGPDAIKKRGAKR